MARHHFVPLSVISNFASPDAWRLVRHSSRKVVKRLDQQALARGNKRNWPICIYEKDKRELSRTIAEKVCSQVGLYAIGNLDRVVYPGAFSEGTAIRFEGLWIWE